MNCKLYVMFQTLEKVLNKHESTWETLIAWSIRSLYKCSGQSVYWGLPDGLPDSLHSTNIFNKCKLTVAQLSRAFVGLQYHHSWGSIMGDGNIETPNNISLLPVSAQSADCKFKEICLKHPVHQNSYLLI